MQMDLELTPTCDTHTHTHTHTHTMLPRRLQISKGDQSKRQMMLAIKRRRNEKYELVLGLPQGVQKQI